MPVALIGGAGLVLSPALGGPKADTPDLQRQVSGSYGSDARGTEERRADRQRIAQRAKRGTPAPRRGEDPWGPFPGPPGLFF